MRNERDEWLAQIRQNPSDWQSMLIFADWLELEECDLLAAEQWRWMAVVHGCSHQCDTRSRYVDAWPQGMPSPKHVLPGEMQWAIRHNIRCMSTYPLTLADVEAYLQTADLPLPQDDSRAPGAQAGAANQGTKENHTVSSQ